MTQQSWYLSRMFMRGPVAANMQSVVRHRKRIYAVSLCCTISIDRILPMSEWRRLGFGQLADSINEDARRRLELV